MQVQNPLPAHIGFVMDGNGRWATGRNKKRSEGHKAGVKNMQAVVEHCFALGIGCVSVFAFSTENWERPVEEREGLFDLVREYLKRLLGDVNKLKKDNIKIEFMGDLSPFAEQHQDILDGIGEVRQACADCDGGVFNIAINYGGRQEIVAAANNAVLIGKQLSQQDFEKLLYTKRCPPLDMMVRTGGQMRLSNFMLYQVAYAELFFEETLWPDFDKQKLDEVLKKFAQRQRNFGKV